MENINNSYFDGYYKDIWRSFIPSEVTVKETAFILEYFNLGPGSKVLDLMCGYGRHTLALARKGVEVTAVDNQGDYIDEIRKTVKRENLTVKAAKTDVTQYKGHDEFDLAICMGNSLNFFSEEEAIKLLSSIASQLKKEGSLLINTWSLAEIVIKQFVERTWTIVNDIKFLTNSKYLFHPSRVETETFFISLAGVTETKVSVDYIFSVGEMKSILNKSGFNLKEIYSVPGRKKFKLGEPTAYIVANKK